MIERRTLLLLTSVVLAQIGIITIAYSTVPGAGLAPILVGCCASLGSLLGTLLALILD